MDHTCFGAPDWTLSYQPILASSDRTSVEKEAEAQIRPLQSPRDFAQYPMMLEFLGVPGTQRLLYVDLECALLNKLQLFLLELGRGFAFVARQYWLSTDSEDFC